MQLKHARVLMTVLAASFAAAQSQPRSSAASTQSQPTASQSQAAQAPNPAQAATPAVTGRPPVQTKTQEEFQAYQLAVANYPNPVAMEKAADDFAEKFPTSDVRVLLYRAAMSGYQEIGNPQKMMDMGMKVLAIDKDDPDALIGVAEILEERTSPTDLDREQREVQVLDYATHALKTIDTDLAVPVGTAPERIENYKKYLRATALAIIGTTYYKQQNYPEAEAKLRSAIDVNAASPDPVVVLRLALALDQQKKFSDALEQANRAVELTKENTDLGMMARNERDRLIVQTGGTQPPAPTTVSPVPAPPQSAAPVNSSSGTSGASGPSH